MEGFKRTFFSFAKRAFHIFLIISFLSTNLIFLGGLTNPDQASAVSYEVHLKCPNGYNFNPGTGQCGVTPPMSGGFFCY